MFLQVSRQYQQYAVAWSPKLQNYNHHVCRELQKVSNKCVTPHMQVRVGRKSLPGPFYKTECDFNFTWHHMFLQVSRQYQQYAVAWSPKLQNYNHHVCRELQKVSNKCVTPHMQVRVGRKSLPGPFYKTECDFNFTWHHMFLQVSRQYQQYAVAWSPKPQNYNHHVCRELQKVSNKCVTPHMQVRVGRKSLPGPFYKTECDFNFTWHHMFLQVSRQYQQYAVAWSPKPQNYNHHVCT